MLVHFEMGIGESAQSIWINPRHIVLVQKCPLGEPPNLALLNHSILLVAGQPNANIMRGSPDEICAKIDGATVRDDDEDPEDVDVWSIIMAWPILAQRVLLTKLKAVCDPNCTLDAIRQASKEIEDLKLQATTNPPPQQ